MSFSETAARKDIFAMHRSNPTEFQIAEDCADHMDVQVTSANQTFRIFLDPGNTVRLKGIIHQMPGYDLCSTDFIADCLSDAEACSPGILRCLRGLYVIGGPDTDGTGKNTVEHWLCAQTGCETDELPVRTACPGMVWKEQSAIVIDMSAVSRMCRQDEDGDIPAEEAEAVFWTAVFRELYRFNISLPFPSAFCESDADSPALSAEEWGYMMCDIILDSCDVIPGFF